MRERENLWLRSILIGVAPELERMATRGQGDTKVLLGLARRVRQRLHQGYYAGHPSLLTADLRQFQDRSD